MKAITRHYNCTLFVKVRRENFKTKDKLASGVRKEGAFSKLNHKTHFKDFFLDRKAEHFFFENKSGAHFKDLKRLKE